VDPVNWAMSRKMKPFRTCLARCSEPVPRHDIFCPDHWAELPHELRQALSNAIDRGLHSQLVTQAIEHLAAGRPVGVVAEKT
jgi:hypothetical protein